MGDVPGVSDRTRCSHSNSHIRCRTWAGVEGGVESSGGEATAWGHCGGDAVPGTELLTSSTSCPGALGAAGSMLSHCSGAHIYRGARPAPLFLGRTGAAAEAPCCAQSH